MKTYATICAGVLPEQFPQSMHRSRRSVRHKIALRFALGSVCALVAGGMLTNPVGSVAAPLAASPNLQVVVEHVTDLGVFQGRHYRQVEGLMTNTWTRADGTTGTYRAPVIMRYPVHGRPGNGVGIVDYPNNASFSFPNEVGRPLTIDDVIQWGDRLMGHFLIEDGFTYIAPQWSQTAVQYFGPDPLDGQRRGLGYGTILQTGATAEDPRRIIQDAARLLRNPPSFGSLVETPVPVEQVLGFGYSQTGGRLIIQFVRGPHNFEADGSLLFDGFILGGSVNVTATPYPQDRGKIITVYSETEIGRAVLDRVSEGLRGYRQYELPGVAHLPTPITPWEEFGAVRQNPADPSPVYRAVVSHLTHWIREGEEPPPSRFMDFTVHDGRIFPAVDADGNALGGVRLPHMPSVLCDQQGKHCQAAGAPLGVYTGVEEPLGFFVGLAGTFDPFSPEELHERYRNRGTYVSLVERAARALRDQRYILQADYLKYVREAARQTLW